MRVKSFQETVRRPRDQKPCTHERHFRNLARAVIHKFDFLADIQEKKDGRRFTWVGANYFQKKCIDYHDGSNFDIRSVWRAIELAIETGVATRGKAIIDGTLRAGYWVARHEDISRLLEHTCVWCIPDNPGDVFDAQNVSQNVSDNVTQNVSQNVSERSSESEGFARSKCHSESDTIPLETAVAENEDKGLHVQNVSESVALSQSCQGMSVMVGEVCTPPSSSFPGDMTVTPECKGERRWAVCDLNWEDTEGALDAISDGVFITHALEMYDRCTELSDALLKMVSANRNTIVKNRLDCRKLMEIINKLLLADNIKPPDGWIPVIKILKQGGPLELANLPISHAEEQAQREAESFEANKAYCQKHGRWDEENNCEIPRHIPTPEEEEETRKRQFERYEELLAMPSRTTQQNDEMEFRLRASRKNESKKATA